MTFKRKQPKKNLTPEISAEILEELKALRMLKEEKWKARQFRGKILSEFSKLQDHNKGRHIGIPEEILLSACKINREDESYYFFRMAIIELEERGLIHSNYHGKYFFGRLDELNK